MPSSHNDARPARERPRWLSLARRWHWSRILLAAIALAVLTAIVILSRDTLAESLASLAHLDWAWLLLAIGFEAVSLAAFGLSRRRLLRADGHDATFGSVMAVTYAGNALSMSLPFAGTQLAVVFTYRQFRRHGVGSAVTGWALAVSAILSTSALALVLVVGAITGGASLATMAGFIGAAVFLVPAVAVLLAIRFRWVRAMLRQAVARLIRIRVVQRLLRTPRLSADGVEDFLDRVASIKLSWLRYAEVFTLAVVNWVADCGCLACVILATGQPVPWHGLLLAYGAGAAVGSTGVTPGGFGLVELTLTAALTAAGLGAAHALGAVLTYRLINFWAILIGGWTAVLVLTRRNRSRRKPADRAMAAGAQRGADPGDGQLTEAGQINQTDLID